MVSFLYSATTKQNATSLLSNSPPCSFIFSGQAAEYKDGASVWFLLQLSVSRDLSLKVIHVRRFPASPLTALVLQEVWVGRFRTVLSTLREI